MKSEDIQIGMKVIPHQKTAEGWEEDINEYKKMFGGGEFLRENGFLYVVEYYVYEKAWVLGEDMMGSGDFFNAEDFEPYV